MTNPTTAIPPAVMRLRELAHSAACAASVRAATLLGIPDALGEEPLDVDRLAEAIHADPDALRRLLRSLATYGIFSEDGDDRYGHTDVSRLLREDAPRSIKYNVLWATEPWTWELWPHLDQAVRTGKGVFEELHGERFFDYIHAEAPESAEVFDRAMTQSSALSTRAIADELDLAGVDSIVDIAGGRGLVLATLLERHPRLTGTLLDLPEVVAEADARLRPGGSLAARARLVGGDCLREIPVQADVYILKNILEWDDASTVLALRNVIAAGRPGARVVVIENLVDGSPELKFTTAMDLLLLLNVGGKKHTAKGLGDLIGQSGLELTTVRPINAYLHMFEAAIPA